MFVSLDSLNRDTDYICAYADSERGEIRQDLRNLHCVWEDLMLER